MTTEDLILKEAEAIVKSGGAFVLVEYKDDRCDTLVGGDGLSILTCIRGAIRRLSRESGYSFEELIYELIKAEKEE